MTAFPTQDSFFPSGAQTTGPVRTGQRQMYSAIMQLLGAQDITTLTLASGVVTATQGVHSIDTQGGAGTDNLFNILQTGLHVGALLLIRGTDNGRIVTVKNSHGGTGQIFTSDGADLVFGSTKVWLLLRMSGTAWEEVMRGYGDQKAAFRAYLGVSAALVETSISGATSVHNSNAETNYVGTTALALTIDHSTTLASNWMISAFAEGGDITVAINGSDAINGGTAGVGMTIKQGYYAVFETDGAGNLYIAASPGKSVLGTAATLNVGTGANNIVQRDGSGNYPSGDGSALTNVAAGVPQNSKSAAYTTVMADANKHIFHPDADTTARTFTIDSNANVAYPIGTTLTFINGHGAGVITIAITSDTMRLAGTGTTGSRTLAADGIATAVKITSTEWKIAGTGLT